MSDDLSGRTLGRYQVLERLGRGGMAEVYRAYQPSLDRFVAIKVIYPHLAGDPALLERFGREARAVAALHHPNIVQVHDFDVQSGSAFMAMEFISGPTLKAAIQNLHQRGQLLPLPIVGLIVGQLADALGYAHEQRVVHRDVKPANVLIRRRGPAEAPLGDAEVDALLLGIGPTSVVLTDSGVARIIKDSVEHTAAGTILGSPAYMSPEQGRGERVDARSDIYSLGIVLYELLTGQVPFDADTPFAIVIKHSTAPLPPPRRLRPDLPTPIEQVLLKALAKDPQDRFQDAAAFGAALREVTGSASAAAGGLTPMPFATARLESDSSPSLGASRETRVVEVTAAPQSAPPTQAAPAAAPQPRPRGGSCLRRSLIGLAVLTVLALIIVGAFVAGGALVFRGLGQAGALVVPTEFSQQATAAAEEGTVLPFSPDAQPSATVDQSDPVAVALADGLAACSGPGCPDGSASRALDIYNAAIADTPDSAELLAARAQLYIWWDLYTYAEEARADIASALDLDDELAAAYLARGSLNWAIVQDTTAPPTPLDDFNRAVELEPELLDAYMQRARYLFNAPDFYNDVSPSRDQVIADTSFVIERDPTDIAALNLRAETYANDRKPDEALADTNTVLTLDPSNVNALMRRGRLNRYQFDNPEAAIADFAAIIAIDPKDSEAHEGHGALLVMAGDYEGALEDAEALVANDPANAANLIFRGFTYLSLGRDAEAQQDFEDALALGDPQAVEARYGRGLALSAQDRAEEAIPDLELAYRSPDSLYYISGTFARGHNRTAIDLARAYIAAGREADAGPILDAAVDQESDWYLPYLERARYRRATGDLAGARADLRVAVANATSDAERAEVEQEQGEQP
jgi:serine/threonine protein kinase/tetratricopeptide (TPR) repeat protein